MQNWDAEKYLNSVSSPNLPIDEEKELFIVLNDEESSEYQKQDATDKICKSHIRFVSQWANYYCKRCTVDMEDMIGSGVVGMMTAIDRFEVSKGYKFTTYCGWWIKLEMIRQIQKSSPVTIPQSVHDALIKIQTAIREAGEDLDREELKERLDFTEDKMRKSESAKIQTVSFQKSYKQLEGASLLEDLIADNAPTPYDTYEKQDLLECLRGILDELDEKTLEIVMSNHEETKVRLQDLADKYGVSPERIRQIRVDITKKLRSRLLEISEVKK